MRFIAPLCLLVATTALGGCMTNMGSSKPGVKSGGAGGMAMAPPGQRDDRGRRRRRAGHRHADTPSGDGLRLVVDAKGMAPGVHGIHIHTVGRCEGPGFTTAGAHWNPTMMKHGSNAPGGPRMGDLPNITITGRMAPASRHGRPRHADRRRYAPARCGRRSYTVIHATADDYLTDPSGNSGGRIACGVINAG